MNTVKIEMEVAKESYELGHALAKLVLDIHTALKSGTAAMLIPTIVADIISTDIVAGIQGMDQIPAEMKDDKMKTILAFAMAGEEIAAGLIAQPATPAPAPVKA